MYIAIQVILIHQLNGKSVLLKILNQSTKKQKDGTIHPNAEGVTGTVAATASKTSCENNRRRLGHLWSCQSKRARRRNRNGDGTMKGAHY